MPNTNLPAGVVVSMYAPWRKRYGYGDITEPRVGFRMTRWLYGVCWTATEHSTWEKMLLETGLLWHVSQDHQMRCHSKVRLISELSQALRRKVAPSSFFDARAEYAKLLLP